MKDSNRGGRRQGGYVHSSETVYYFFPDFDDFLLVSVSDVVEGLMFTHFLQSVESVTIDGSGRQSFSGLFRRLAFSLAVIGSSFYWVDDEGLWQVSQRQPEAKRLLSRAKQRLVAVYHPLQQPQGTRSRTFCTSDWSRFILDRNNICGSV